MNPVSRVFEQADLRDSMYLFLPFFLSGAFTALVLAVQSFTGLFSDRNEVSQQSQSISKGASR